MKTTLVTVLLLLALCAPATVFCAPTAADVVKAYRASRGAKNPNAQPLTVFNREFIEQDALRRARQYANGSDYGMVFETTPQNIPASVHTIIVNQNIRDANVVYVGEKPK